MKTMKKIALAAGLIAAFGCSSSEQQEKVLLRGAPTKGLVYTHERTERVKGYLDIQADNVLNRQPLEKDERRVWEDEILDVQEGRIMRLRRKTLEWNLKRQKPGEQALTDVPRTTIGKSFVLQRTDLGTEYEEAEGLAVDELKMNLLGALEAIVSPPADPVSVGTTWELDGERLVEMFGGEGSSRPLKVRDVTGTGTLQAVDPASRVALIAVKLKAQGAFRVLLDVDVTVDMTATIRFDLAAGRPLGFEAHADGKIAGEIDRKGRIAYYNGQFAFDAKGSNKYR